MMWSRVIASTLKPMAVRSCPVMARLSTRTVVPQNTTSPSPQATLVPGAPPSMWRTESAANFLATRCAVRGRGERGRFQAPRKVV